MRTIDVVVVRLIAAAQLQAHEAVPVRLCAPPSPSPSERGYSGRGRTRPRYGPGRSAATDTPPAPGRDRQRASRPTDAAWSDAAETLTRALVERSTAMADEGEPTAGASLYLLSRAVLDGGLPGLATAHGVPLGALLAGLAVSWLRLEWPLDGPAHDWTGAALPRGHRAVGARRSGAAVDRTRRGAARTAARPGALRDRSGGTGESSADAPAGSQLWSPSVAATLDEIARTLLRSWARWLPGLKEASAGFLLARCLRRGGAVRVSDSHIAVTLDPAPLDVVLQMAGYLQPIAAVPWRDGRAVSFTVRRRPTA